MRRRQSLRALLGLLFLGVTACEEGTPVSPPNAIIHISANPTRITRTGVSNLTVQVLRSNGIPVNPGTEVRLSSTLGTVEPVIHTDDDGVAHGTLRGDGRAGTATVSAYSGNVEPVTTEIAVGAAAATITISANPTSIPETGDTVRLLALVRDEDGQPLADASVNFSTEAGSLQSGGRFLTTDARGEVTDRLTVTASELQTITADSFTVRAESGGASGSISDETEIGIQRAPRASFTFTITGTRAAFTDTSSGNPNQWAWDFDGLGSSTQQNPVFDFGASGSYLVTLTVRNAVGFSTANATVTIP